jgi:hypothetical protein
MESCGWVKLGRLYLQGWTFSKSSIPRTSGTTHSELPLLPKVWYLVGVSYNRKTGRAELYQERVLNRYNSLVGKVVPHEFASHVVGDFGSSGRSSGA